MVTQSSKFPENRLFRIQSPGGACLLHIVHVYVAEESWMIACSYAVVTCEIKLFQPSSTSVRNNLFQRMETYLKLFQN